MARYRQTSKQVRFWAAVLTHRMGVTFRLGPAPMAPMPYSPTPPVASVKLLTELRGHISDWHGEPKMVEPGHPAMLSVVFPARTVSHRRRGGKERTHG